MLKHSIRAVAGTAALALAAASLAACSASSDPAGPATLDPNEKVTITVGNMPTSDNAANLELFNQQVDQFQDAHPNVTVEGVETKFDPQTFAALVAGGSMPTTMIVPYTNIQQLAANGQAKDITDAVAADEQLAQLITEIQAQTKDADGNAFGVVTAAYTMALIYNRALYVEAGLDPDSPPTTWDEVAQNAKKIADASDAAGFTLSTTNNSGGWSLAAMSYAFGSELQDPEDDEVIATRSTHPASPTRWISCRRSAGIWTPQDELPDEPRRSSHRNRSGPDRADRAGDDLYRDVVGNRKMPGDDLGIAPLPQAKDGIGTLGGGDVSIVSPKATAGETAAALEWIKFRYLNRFIDEDAAVAMRRSPPPAASRSVRQKCSCSVRKSMTSTWSGWRRSSTLIVTTSPLTSTV